MATRNRTALFRKHRDAIKAVRMPDSSLMDGGGGGRGSGGPVIEMTALLNSHASSSSSYTPLNTEDPSTSSRDALTVGLPPAWVDIAEEITANIQRARIKMAELVKAHSKALMPSFEDGREDQRRIEGLTLEITDILRRSEKRLKELSARGPSEDSGVRKNVQRSLATDLQNLSFELRKKQSTYLKRLRQQKEGADGVDLEMNLNGSMLKAEEDEFSDIDFDSHQMSELKKDDHLTAEREREITQVVQSVNELAQIMKDLSVLVIDQGTIVDRIDYNICILQYQLRKALNSFRNTAFLIGPKRQVAMMLDPVRIYATALYLASMIIALFCALYVHNKLLTLLAIILEFGALTWYSLSYIPFARSMVSRVLVSCFDTEF